MKEEQKDYHLISLEGAKAPRYLQIPKEDVKKFKLLVISSAGLFILVSLLISIITFKEQLKNFSMPLTKEMSPEEKYQLEIKDLESQITSLTEKLNSMPNTAVQTQFLGINQTLLESPYGMKDLTAEKKIRVEDLKVTKSDGINFEFNIINNFDETTKIAGFIWVAALQGTKIIYYPQSLTNPNQNSVKFSQGESFAVTRLRPVKSVFNDISAKVPTSFIVILFSREGDLLFYQKSEPYEIP